MTARIERADPTLVLVEKILGQRRQWPDTGNICRDISIHFQPRLSGTRTYFQRHGVRVDGDLDQLANQRVMDDTDHGMFPRRNP